MSAALIPSLGLSTRKKKVNTKTINPKYFTLKLLFIVPPRP
jgi:hypothetical protein